MFKGTLSSIHITPTSGQPTTPVPEVQAVPGKGLAGDRHYRNDGSTPDAAITLIESEALAALAREHNIQLAPGESRRNLVTEGVPLNHLVGQEFRVGEVVLKGHELCEPCAHLASLTQAKVLPALVHRGGLRASIVSGGIIRVGDAIEIK